MKHRSSGWQSNKDANSHVPVKAATSIYSALFKINSTKPVSVVTLLINNNINSLENLKQCFKITVSCNKYRSEITT